MADLVSIGTGFPGQKLGIDVVEFPRSRSGNKYALTMMDYFIRFIEVSLRLKRLQKQFLRIGSVAMMPHA